MDLNPASPVAYFRDTANPTGNAIRIHKYSNRYGIACILSRNFND